MKMKKVNFNDNLEQFSFINSYFVRKRYDGLVAIELHNETMCRLNSELYRRINYYTLAGFIDLFKRS